jgi:hypothetical protein
LAIKIIKLSPTIDQNKRKLKLDILSSGMLMQAAEVRSTATNVRSTAEENCQRGCARTQTRDELARRRARSGIGGSAFDRKDYVRPHCLFFEFSKNRTECQKQPKKNKLKGQIKYEQNLQCRKNKN